jgi:hypothetical protein
MNIYEYTYFRRQHVTGPGSVLVSIKFGKTPESGVLLVKRLALKQEYAVIQFDLKMHVEEILAGVQNANEKYMGNLEVEEIEVVPNDSPKRGQAMAAAYKIAEHVLTKDIK